MFANPYQTLGIHDLASNNEIKRAFRGLAKLYHPDKNKSSAAENTFKQINEAYNQTLKINQENKYTSIIVVVPTTLEELYNGTHKTVEYTRITKQNIEEPTTLQVYIPPGTPNDEKIIITAMGNEKEKTGDLIIQTVYTPHSVFTRENNDLHINIFLTFKESLIGTTKTITKLDGTPMKLKFKGPIQHGKQVVFKNKGMNNKGNLVAHITTEFPTCLTQEQKETIEQYF